MTKNCWDRHAKAWEETKGIAGESVFALRITQFFQKEAKFLFRCSSESAPGEYLIQVSA